ncbi:MAG: 30S ribosomal protein S13 [Actinomycetales bacterium]|nr:30S ribosomal protein S13 [Actinomycetales bacterium]
MALPALTPEQRTAALEKAAAARAQRAEMKTRLKSGAVSLSQMLDDADTDEALSKMKVMAMLEALPGVGHATARSVMEEIGISEARRVRGLGPHQRKALVERFG